MNFQNSSSLADFQDNLFLKYKNGIKITEKEKNILNGNMWVKLAETFSPCNLVTRHFCLIDLINQTPENDWRILNQMKILTKFDSNPLWSEGYSYWLYTRKMLIEYASKLIFADIEIIKLIDEIDTNFVLSAYERNGLLYPAPFGDLRNIPLSEQLQGKMSKISFVNKFLTKTQNDTYIVSPVCMGFNTHPPFYREKYVIRKGTPYKDSDLNKEFKWYGGYDKKYKNKTEEILDYIKPRRLFSILFQTYQ